MLLAVLVLGWIASGFRSATGHAADQEPHLAVLPAGWVAQQRFGAFLVSNQGPTMVALTPRFRLEMPTATGWTTMTQAFLPQGGYLSPGQSVHLSVPIPPGTNAVRLVVLVQPSRRSSSRDWLHNATVSLMERLGASPLVPRVHEATGTPLVRPPFPPDPGPSSGN